MKKTLIMLLIILSMFNIYSHNRVYSSFGINTDKYWMNESNGNTTLRTEKKLLGANYSFFFFPKDIDFGGYAAISLTVPYRIEINGIDVDLSNYSLIFDFSGKESLVYKIHFSEESLMYFNLGLDVEMSFCTYEISSAVSFSNELMFGLFSGFGLMISIYNNTNINIGSNITYDFFNYTQVDTYSEYGNSSSDDYALFNDFGLLKFQPYINFAFTL